MNSNLNNIRLTQVCKQTVVEKIELLNNAHSTALHDRSLDHRPSSVVSSSHVSASLEVFRRDPRQPVVHSRIRDRCYHKTVAECARDLDVWTRREFESRNASGTSRGCLTRARLHRNNSPRRPEISNATFESAQKQQTREGLANRDSTVTLLTSQTFVLRNEPKLRKLNE